MSNTASKLRIQEKNPLNSGDNAKVGSLTLVKTGQAFPQNKVMIRKRKNSQHPLRELRIRSTLTLEELAQMTQMSPSYLSRLESGSRRLNADIMQRLSIALSCQPGELLPPNNFAATPAASITGALKADLPVFILKANAATKAAVLEPTAQDKWMVRPLDLIGVQDAFACTVKEATWAPRYRAGDCLMIHPTAPLKEGCAIILTTNDNKAFIGTFQSCTGPIGSQVFKCETTFSKDVQALSFNLKEIKAYRITGTVEAA